MKNKEIVIGIILFVVGIAIGYLFIGQTGGEQASQEFRDFTTSAGDTWSNVIPLRYAGSSCERWFVSLNIGQQGELDYCLIKDFEIRNDYTASTINCRCWLK